MYTPKTASQAARSIVLNVRAEAILAEGYCFSFDTELNTVYVTKPRSLLASYWITNGKCDCPARQKEETCKHELAAEILRDEQARVAAQIAKLEEDHEARYYLHCLNI